MCSTLVFSPSTLSEFFETLSLAPFFADLRKTDNSFDDDTHERFCYYIDELCKSQDSAFLPYLHKPSPHVTLFGTAPNHHKDETRSRWTRFSKQNATPTIYIFTSNLLECFMEHLFIHCNWRFNVRILSQIPSSLYQAIKKNLSPSLSLTKLFPLLSPEREAIRSQLYPRMLNDVVCVLRILHYEGKADEHREMAQQKYLEKNAKKRKRQQETDEEDHETSRYDEEDDDEDDVASDLSLLEDQRVENNGNLSLVSFEKLHPKMCHKQWPIPLECEYSCYAISATLFTLALSITSPGKEVLSSYLVMRQCLSDKARLNALQDSAQKEMVSYLLRVLSRNPSHVTRLENQALVFQIRSILEFFRNARFLLEKQVAQDEYRILSHRTGQLTPFLELDANDTRRRVFPTELYQRVKEPRQFLVFKVIDPLSLNTSLLILKSRFLDGNVDSSSLYAIYFESDLTYLCIHENFYRDIQRLYVPYLCTTNSFLKRPGLFGMLYPIHVQNFFSGDHQAMLIAIKSMLRLFFVFRGHQTRHVIPRPEDAAADFLRLLSPILDLFEPCEIRQYLDEPFFVPNQLRFSKRTQLATGINEDSWTLYSALRSFCFVYKRHEMIASTVKDLLFFFQGHPKVSEKWNLVAYLVSNMARAIFDSYESNITVDIPDRLIPDSVFPFPNHLLLYLFIAFEKQLPRLLAIQVFLGMRPVFSRRRTMGKISFPATQPGLVHHEALENKYLDLFKKLEMASSPSLAPPSSPLQTESDEKQRKPRHNLIVLFEYLEQCSFYSTQASYDEYVKKRKETLSKHNAANEKPRRFLSLDYDWILKQKNHLSEQLPLYFDQSKPVISKQVFPIWTSELNHPVCFTRRKTQTENGRSPSELRPFIGAHKDLLNCMVLFPCLEMIQLLD